jgi:hypothetical protein
MSDERRQSRLARGAAANSNVRRYVTTREAAEILRYRSPSGIRNAVRRGDLHPAGTGPRGTFLFTIEELERFVRRRGGLCCGSPRSVWNDHGGT